MSPWKPRRIGIPARRSSSTGADPALLLSAAQPSASASEALQDQTPRAAAGQLSHGRADQYWGDHFRNAWLAAQRLWFAVRVTRARHARLRGMAIDWELREAG